jgi:hypothetical protein
LNNLSQKEKGSLFSYKLRVLGFDVNHGGFNFPALLSFAMLFFFVRFNESEDMFLFWPFMLKDRQRVDEICSTNDVLVIMKLIT